MRIARKLWLLWVLLAVTSLQAEVLDRIAARVNRQAIFLSEVEDELRFEEFSGSSEAPGINMDEALQRIIDRTLIVQQMARTSMPAAPEKEVQARLVEFRKETLPGADDAAWLERLAAHNLTVEELESRIADEVRIAGYIDMRFRAMVRVSRAEVEAYYEKQLKPRMEEHKQAVPPLQKVSGQITEILTQQQISANLNEWLQGLRSQSQIEIRLSPSGGSGATGAKP